MLPTDASVYDEKDFLIPGNALLKEEQEAGKQHLQEMLSKQEEEKVEEHMSAEPLNKRKILIVEDDNDVREFLKEELSPYFEVVAESDGISGLERDKVYETDLIISDVLMP